MGSLNIKKAEWVCFFFLLYSLVRIISSSYPLDWTQIRWSTFPRVDILSIAIAVGLLKLSRKNRLIGFTSIVLLVLSFYGFTEMSDDSFIPIKKILGTNVVSIMTNFRYLFLILFLTSLYALMKKNQLNLIDSFQKIRILIPFFIIVYLYPFVPLIINTGWKSGINDRDNLLAKIDNWIFIGHNPLLLIESWISPMLSEIMAFSYSTYGPMFAIVFGCLYLKDEDEPATEMIFMSTLTLAIGYIFYTLVPAKGPLFTQEFSIPLDIYYMKEFKTQFMDQPRIDRDCFPSLHTALTIITMYCAWKNIPRLFWILILIAVLVPAACIYLRYHYVIDVMAGCALAVLVIYFSNKKLIHSKFN